MWDNDEKDVSAALAVAKMANDTGDLPLRKEGKPVPHLGQGRRSRKVYYQQLAQIAAMKRKSRPSRRPEPMSEAEAREKIEAFLARKGAALCPVRACAAVQNGTGFAQ